MWLHRSGVAWIYLLLFTLHIIFSSASHISHLLLCPLHLYLLHKLTAPYIADLKSLNSLRSRFVLTVILTPIVINIHSLWRTLEIPFAFLVILFSKYKNWRCLAQALSAANTGALQSPVNNTALQLTGVTPNSNSKPSSTLNETSTSDFAIKTTALVVRSIFEALWSTTLAWLLPKGHLSMVTTVSDGYVRIGEVKLRRVMAFALVGALGLRVGHHMSELCRTFIAKKTLSGPWWRYAVIKPLQQVMSLSRALVSAGTFAKNTVLNHEVWSEIWLLLLLNFLCSIAEALLATAGIWENFSLTRAFSVPLAGGAIFYTGWKCSRHLGRRNKGSEPLGR